MHSHPVEQDTFPSYRCTEEHEIAEERRLLYVAMTRAQVFLVCAAVVPVLTTDYDPLAVPHVWRRRQGAPA
jgi:superfamily I DNA/RNA helicase